MNGGISPCTEELVEAMEIDSEVVRIMVTIVQNGSNHAQKPIGIKYIK